MVYFMGYTRMVSLCYFSSKQANPYLEMVAVVNFAKAGISSRFFCRIGCQQRAFFQYERCRGSVSCSL